MWRRQWPSWHPTGQHISPARSSRWTAAWPCRSQCDKKGEQENEQSCSNWHGRPITPVGNDVDTFWNSLKQGTVGIGPITSFDTADYKVKLAAEVKDFDPKQYMDPKAARRMERFSQLAVAASKQASEDAGIDMEKEDPYRVGVCVSSGIGRPPGH